MVLSAEIENIIFEFANIKCHGCLKLCNWYYCSKECYEFI